MRGELLILLAGLALAGIAAAETDAAVDGATGLIIDTGWNDVRAHCGACHSHALVTQQQADRPTWLGWIRWMQQTQNLWQFDPVTESRILDYLAKNYPPKADRRRAPISKDLMPQATVKDE